MRYFFFDNSRQGRVGLGDFDPPPSRRAIVKGSGRFERHLPKPDRRPQHQLHRLSATVALLLAGDSRRRSVLSPVRPLRSHRRLLPSIGVRPHPRPCPLLVLGLRGAENPFTLDLDRHSASAGFVAVGLFRGSFTLLVGMGCGVYIAQNYNVPNVKKLFNTYVFLAKHIEETYRKPKKDDN